MLSAYVPMYVSGCLRMYVLPFCVFFLVEELSFLVAHVLNLADKCYFSGSAEEASASGPFIQGLGARLSRRAS